jgi:DNA-binding response OmpR family regulator
MARILVADDDLDTVEILRIKLEGAGYEVVAARDGQECIGKCQETSPDLLILDVMMPKVSGFKVAKLFKSDATLEKMPIIILTARTQDSDRRLALEIEADEYITKPFDPDGVLNTVKRLLGKR